MGTNVWAYTIPTGMEVKEVVLGTLLSGDVSAATFDDESATVPSFTNSSSFSITNAVPTDQWCSLTSCFSENVLRLGSRSTHELDFSSAITSGKVVFAADFYIGTHAKTIKFIDADNKVVARFAFPDKTATNGRVYSTQYMFVDIDEAATFSSTPQINDTYNGTRNREYRIKELVFDLDNNKITYSGSVMDRRNGSNNWCDDNATITLSKSVSIKGVIIDASACGNNTYYAYFDNMKLYSVGNAAGTYNYTINAVAGGTTIKKISVGNTTSGEIFSAYIPEAIYYNGQYYQLDDNSTYYVEYTMGDADVTKEINYTLDATIKGYWECEALSYVGHSFYSNGAQSNNSACSGGATVCPYSGTSNGIKTGATIPSGIYNITVKPYNWDVNYATSYTLQYSTDNTTWTTIGTVSFAANSHAAYVAENVLIPGDSYLRLMSPSSTPRHSLDYIIAKRTGDATASVTVSTAGYATYVNNDYDLDFSSTGIEAYKVKVSTKGVATLTKVDNVPAGTPVLLYKDGGATEDIPVMTGAAAVSDNDLVAGTGAAVATADGDYTNMILNNIDGNVGFYFAAGQTVAANRAYLHIASTLAPDAADAARMQMVFDGEATGIENVRSEVKDGQFFNLSGQRVAAPQKGLYIVNGKKVIIK